MSHIVNRTFEAAKQWQQAVVWIRVNVGYIQAELEYLSTSGYEVSDVRALLESFDPVFEQFCRDELAVFVAARMSETDDEAKNTVVASLERMREAFRAWLHDYDVLVVKERATDEASGPTVLLQCCGGEILKAHAQFLSIVDGFTEALNA